MNLETVENNEGKTQDVCEIGNFFDIEEIRDPFSRRDSIQRTPPGAQILQEENTITRDEIPGDINKSSDHPTKRKRADLTPEEKSKTSRDKFGIAIDKMLVEINTLHHTIGDMYKPKQEIKNAVKMLRLYAEEVQSNELSDWFHSVSRKEKELDQLAEENRLLREEIKKLQTNCSKNKSPIQDVVCENCKKEQILSERRTYLKKSETLECFLDISDSEWETGLFPALKTEARNISEAPDGSDLILPCNSSFHSKTRVVQLAINQLACRDLLIKQGKSKGEIAMVSHTLGFPNDNGNLSYVTKNIIFPIISQEDEDSERESIFRAVKAIKESHLLKDRKYMAVPKLQGKSGNIFERTLQYLFANTNTQVVIYDPPDNRNKNLKLDIPKVTQTPSKNKKSPTVGTPSVKKKPNHETLIVKMEDKSYADLLKTVKNSVNPSDIGVDVRNVMKSRNGELILTVGNGKDKAEVLKNEISSKLPAAKISVLKRTKVIHLKGMDEVVTENEIKEAILKKAAIKPENYEVRKLRPAFGNKQNATIIITETDAQKLTDLSSIRIGWTECKITERKMELKCFRCWGLGHRKNQCKGPNREHLCLKCAQEGHTASVCTNSPFCIHCEEKGHQSNSRLCRSDKTSMKAEASNSTNKHKSPPSELQ